MAQINYMIGDALIPVNDDKIPLICHICNDIGKWGAGFTGAISKKWKEPEKRYRQWFARKDNTFELGMIQYVLVDENMNYYSSNRKWIINMVAQHKIFKDEFGGPPIRYDALKQCFERIVYRFGDKRHCSSISYSIHMPRIGCGLAGGKWEKIEEIINNTLIPAGYEVYVYDLPSEVKANVNYINKEDL